MARSVRKAEQVLARLAGAQHGIVTWAEMLAAGLSEDEIRHRIEIGLLIKVHRAVYSVGHRVLTTEASYMAAVKAGGEGAVLWGRAAAYLLGIVKGATPPPAVLTRTEKRIRGVDARVRVLDPRDITEYNGIPCTTVPCTIVHLAGELDDEDVLARVCHEAGVKFGTTPRHVEAVLERRPNSKGAKTLRLIASGGVKVTLSVLEDGFFDALRAAGFPLPDSNKRVGKHRVDCHWSKYGVTVELVSFRYHNSKYAWDKDHDREREARMRGEEWRQFTYDDVFKDQTYMLGELRKLLTER
jgi:hypothetical protein